MTEVKVWEESFSNRLRLRPSSQHSKCTTCVTHKAIMKKLSSHKEALAFQSRLWGQHMEKQFADRQTYWRYRSYSRHGADINGRPTVCLIIDSMDHCKWSVPRTSVLAAKSMNGLIRSILTCAGIIIHGHLVATILGHPGVAKGGNWTPPLVLISETTPCISSRTTLRLKRSATRWSAC